jgi:hypothetical protein
MPLAGLITPAGKVIALEDCARLSHEFGLARSTLQTLISRERDSEIHVTQLINGTMMEYLRRTKDYVADPQWMAFSLVGSGVHALLEQYGGYVHEVDIELDCGGVRVVGRADVLEPSEDGGWTLVDYKVWGSYRVARALGLEKVGGVFVEKKENQDLYEPTLQLNAYRVGLESLGYKISSMKLQVIVRDAGLSVATNRGVTRSFYLIDIPRVEDDKIMQYFTAKAKLLVACLEAGVEPSSPCNDIEAWGGERCRNYCEVAKYCPRGKVEAIAKQGRR